MRSALPPRPRVPRLGAFAAVAGLGLAVQVTAIVLLTWGGIHLALATAAGVALAILHNFAWHERWTWVDRGRTESAGARLGRVVLCTGPVSLIGTVALTTLYASALGAPIVVANLMAVWSVGLFNYLLLDRVVYRDVT